MFKGLTYAASAFALLGFGACAVASKSDSAKLNHKVASCGPVRDTLLAANQSIEGLEGNYRLLLVKTDSVVLPLGSFSGSLYLWRTSSKDSSLDGRRPQRGDSLRSFYFGTTDVDLDRAEAHAGYYGSFWRTTAKPKREDIDPIRPPILGHLFKGTFSGQDLQYFWLLMGTLHNDRSKGGGLDGMGIMLDVKKITRAGFFGTWDRFGIVKTGAGYFCAYGT